MAKTTVIDWRDFFCTDDKRPAADWMYPTGAAIVSVQMLPAPSRAASSLGDIFSGDAAWGQPVYEFLEHQVLPVALIMGAWVTLEFMIGRPASAIDKLKYAGIAVLASGFIGGFFVHLYNHSHHLAG